MAQRDESETVQKGGPEMAQRGGPEMEAVGQRRKLWARDGSCGPEMEAVLTLSALEDCVHNRMSGL